MISKNKKNAQYKEDKKEADDLKKNKIYKDNDDDSDEGEKDKRDDFIHRALYKPKNDYKNRENNEKEKFNYNGKKREKDVENKDKESSNKFVISMEKTDDIQYNIKDKKIYSNSSNIKQEDYKTKNQTESKEKEEYPSYEKRKINIPKSDFVINERTIDFYVIDGDDDENIVVSTKYKKKIDRKRNKFKEIVIEKFDSETPMRNDLLTGFVLIRKDKGKRIYKLELEDNINIINNLLRNKEVMINNELIQIIPLVEINKYKDKISKLQNELNNKEFSNGKEKEKEMQENNEKDRKIAILEAKNDEISDIVIKQGKQINQNEKELKQIKASYDKLKESYQSLEKENKALADQVESYKLKKKVVQMKIDEQNDQKNIKNMKERIKKYKDELRKVPPPEFRHLPEVQKQTVEESEDDDDLKVGEGGDPKGKKMKNAVIRFKKKYHDVIKEEKKNKKLKEKEEKERLENEERELEDNQNIEEENGGQFDEEKLQREREEREREEREREEREREEREREEREEREREEREREERERVEREREEREREEREREEREKEEREREEIARIEREKREFEERERKEREKREREERERKEREKREREERERKEREKREREERERKEREKREREERERKERERKEKERKEKERREKEKRDREEKERKERERREKERKEKEEKDKKDRKDKKDKPVMAGRFGGGNKMMGGNFAKMLADKLKVAPPGAKRPGPAGGRQSISKPVVENNVNVVQLLEEQPFKGRRDKRKPTRKVFVEEFDE